MKEYRIYVNNKLANINYSVFALGCNLSSYKSNYGEENVEVKEIDSKTKDEQLIREKREWLNSFKI